MSGFSADWLSLREPADAAARSESLTAFVDRSGVRGPERAALRALDLGGGTGANIRYLSPRLRGPQQWTIVDNDAALLERAPAHAKRRHVDLNAAVDDAQLFDGSSLVTASALLDLVSAQWLEKLVERSRAAGADVLFALTYDGRIVCSPEESEDANIRRLVNVHQTRDKGFGPALGPDAARRVIELLTAAGYTTKQEQSDWNLKADAVALQRELISGWADAASDVAPEKKTSIDGWRARRLAHLDAGRSHIVVGHVDVAGVFRA
jgi:hypothetical protein